MGTRHLIIIFHDGKYKLAQYGQWDGYPEGQGVRVLKFLSDENNVVKLIANLDKLYKPTQKELDELNVKIQKFRIEAELRLKQFDDVGITHNDTKEILQAQEQACHPNGFVCPSLSRDTGAKILEIIANADKPVPILDDLEFVGDSLYCEWSYIIELDSGMLEVYTGGSDTFEVLKQRERKGVNGPNSDLKMKKSSPGFIGSWELRELPSEEQFLQDIARMKKDKGLYEDEEDVTTNEDDEDDAGNT